MCGGSGLDTQIQEGQNGYWERKKQRTFNLDFSALNTLKEKFG